MSGDIILTRDILTPMEEQYCRQIAEKIGSMRALLNSQSLGISQSPNEWHKILAALRHIQGNLSNDISFIAKLLTKQYLGRTLGVSFDATAKPQGAPGIDIDILMLDGERLVGEIKTTDPCKANDFGAQQAANFKKDFFKLSSVDAKYKFLFVTEKAAFSVLKKPKYAKLIPGIRIVLLTTSEEYVA